MNVGYILSHAAERRPDAPAFLWGDLTTSYGAADTRTTALATALVDLGITPGDRIGILMPNCPELLESFFGAWKAGACVVPLNARFLSSEVAYHLRDPQATAVIFAPEYSEMLNGLRDALPLVKRYICTGDPASGHLSYRDLVESQQAGASPSVRVSDADPAWLFYTSGTTGQPKGAILTHENLTFMAVSWVADLMHLEPEDVGLHAAPLTHGAGFHSIPLTMKAAAHVFLTPPRFSPEAFCSAVSTHRVTNTWLVPTQIKMLLRYPSLTDWDLSSLKWLLYGGAPMYVEDIKEALRRLGPVLVQLYGQGETPMTATYLRAKDHIVDGPESMRLASSGVARSGIEVQILDEVSQEMPRNEMGEICVRGPSVMKGYWERRDATAAALRDGWLRTGDLGYMDPNGYVYILDRNKDMIISGGSNVYPREIEEVLMQHPAVQEVCVIGVPDDLWGEAVKALVVLRADCAANEEEIVAFAAGRIAAYKKPKSVEFVSELPKNPYGKVLKRELREKYRS